MTEVHYLDEITNGPACDKRDWSAWGAPTLPQCTTVVAHVTCPDCAESVEYAETATASLR